jgi:hypothetical protein
MSVLDRNGGRALTKRYAIPKIAPDNTKTLMTCPTGSPIEGTISNSRRAPLRKAATSMINHTPKALTQSMMPPFGSITCPLASQSLHNAWQARALALGGARPRQPRVRAAMPVHPLRAQTHCPAVPRPDGAGVLRTLLRYAG